MIKDEDKRWQPPPPRPQGCKMAAKFGYCRRQLQFARRVRKATRCAPASRERILSWALGAAPTPGRLLGQYEPCCNLLVQIPQAGRAAAAAKIQSAFREHRYQQKRQNQALWKLRFFKWFWALKPIKDSRRIQQLRHAVALWNQNRVVSQMLLQWRWKTDRAYDHILLELQKAGPSVTRKGKMANGCWYMQIQSTMFTYRRLGDISGLANSWPDSRIVCSRHPGVSFWNDCNDGCTVFICARDKTKVDPARQGLVALVYSIVLREIYAKTGYIPRDFMHYATPYEEGGGLAGYDTQGHK